jgi:predicted porin
MKQAWLAISLIAPAALATADTIIYGALQGNIGNNTVSASPVSNTLEDTSSHVGIKGSESLGSGLKLRWQVEYSTPLDGTATEMQQRETFVGLAAEHYGQLRIGNLDSALKDLYTVNVWQFSGGPNQSARSADGNPGRNVGAGGLGPLTNSGNWLGNAIRYDAPVVAGLSAKLIYALGENRSTDHGPQRPGVRHASDIVSLGLGYTHGQLFANYAWQREANPLAANPNGGKRQRSAQTGTDVATAFIHYIEAGYRNDSWLAAAAYQYSRGYDWTDSFSGDSHSLFGSPGNYQSSAQYGVQNRQAALSVRRALGALQPKISLARGWNQRAGGESLSDSGYRQFIIGADYVLSKRTQANLSHGRLIFDANASAAVSQQRTKLTTTALGLQHSF